VLHQVGVSFDLSLITVDVENTKYRLLTMWFNNNRF